MSAPQGLRPIAGHEAIRERLETAARTGRLPQSMLLHGPAGVGKQRLALWLARLLLCERQTGCGECQSCRDQCPAESHVHGPLTVRLLADTHRAGTLRQSRLGAAGAVRAIGKGSRWRSMTESDGCSLFAAALSQRWPHSSQIQNLRP